jgi:hypothetical protein
VVGWLISLGRKKHQKCMLYNKSPILRTRDLHIMAHEFIFFGNGKTRARENGTRDLQKN